MRKTVFFFAFLSAFACAAEPYLAYCYPAGATRGTTATLLFGGMQLRRNGGLHNGLITGGGVTFRSVRVIPGFPNPDGKQRAWLLAWLKNPAQKPPLPEDTSLWNKHPWWDSIDTLSEFEREILHRALTVGSQERQAAQSMQELVMAELEIAPDAAPGLRELRLTGPAGTSNPRAFRIDASPRVRDNLTAAPMPPVVLEGRILRLETDRFTLPLAGGTPYALTLHARSLQPFIGDTVPGYFQATLRIADAQGRTLAFSDENGFDPDPRMAFTPPADGTYTVEINDNLHRGREDFVYSLVIEPAKPTEPSPLPVILPGMANTHAFTGKQGEQRRIAVTARRAGSPLDPFIRVFAPGGTLLAEADDTPPPFNTGLHLQHADPELTLTLPAAGEYTVEVTDATAHGGPDYTYALAIEPATPDFTLYSTASSINLRPGERGSLTIAIARNGFAGPVKITSATPGIEASGTLEAGKDRGKITVVNRQKAGSPPIPVALLGTSETLTRPVIPADEREQAFAWKHLQPAQTLYLTTLRPAPKK